MNNLYTIQNDEEYLEHHGILGQRWGHKNGPPYPIAPGDHSAAEKKAGAESSSEKKSIKESIKTSVNNTSNKVKKTLNNTETSKTIQRAKQMSDKELDQAVNRLKKEKEFIELQGKTITQGQNFVENMAIIAGTTLITTLVTKGSGKAAEAIVASVLAEIAGDKVFKAVYPKK